MDKPLVIPEATVPIGIIPVSEGARVTEAPGIGVNALSGVVDWYNCAAINPPVPTTPPTSDVSMTGVPEANGMIAPRKKIRGYSTNFHSEKIFIFVYNSS